MSKVTKDQYIKDLEHDMGRLTDMVIELTEDNKRLKKDLTSLVLKVPSKLLVSSGDKYIYESPDGGETIFRRKFNDDNSSKEKIDKDGNPYPEQLNLFK